MIHDHSAYFAVIWNCESRRFTGIVTLRNILELLLFIIETLEHVKLEGEDSRMV